VAVQGKEGGGEKDIFDAAGKRVFFHFRNKKGTEK